MRPIDNARSLLRSAAGAPTVLHRATAPTAALGRSDLAKTGQDTMLVDIGLADGKITFVQPSGAARPHDWAVADLAGGMVWPAFVDVHTHLDSAQIWSRTPNADGSFEGAAGAMFDFRDQHWTGPDMRRRIEFGLRCAYAHGTRAMRTHLASQNAQVDERWEIFGELRDEWADRVDLQGSPLIAIDAMADDAALETMASRVKRHGGVLGVFAPMADDIETRLHPLLATAERHGLSLDIHADETAASSSQVLAAIASVALARNFQGSVLVGHCCSLAQQDEATVDRTLDQVARAGLNIVSLPGCNLYLQGRRPGRTPLWRGVTLLHEMKARGIPVALGGDNCRDPFYPYGDYDMAETFRDAVRIAHLDHPIGDWPAAVSSIPAAIMGLPAGDLAAGRAADLVLFPARSFSELLARPTSDRLVIRDGRPIEAKLPDYSELDVQGSTS